MKRKLVLPEFKDEQEESEFWDKLDLLEYFKKSDFSKVIFPNLKRTAIQKPD